MLVFNMTKKKKYILGILVLTIILVIVGIDLFNRFVKEETYEEGTYFSDNFDRNKKEWSFYHNGESKPAKANVEKVDGNKALRAVGSYWAKIDKEWDDYSLKFRFKRIKGSMIDRDRWGSGVMTLTKSNNAAIAVLSLSCSRSSVTRLTVLCRVRSTFSPGSSSVNAGESSPVCSSTTSRQTRWHSLNSPGTSRVFDT